MLRCLVFVDLTTGDEDLREVGVDCEAESGPSNPHLGTFFKLAIHQFVGRLERSGTVDIPRASNDKSSAIGKGHHSVHEALQECSLVYLIAEDKVGIRNAPHDSVRTLLHKRIIAIGANDKRTSWLILLNGSLHLNLLRLRLRWHRCCWLVSLLGMIPSVLLLDHLLDFRDVRVHDFLDLLHLGISMHNWLGRLLLLQLNQLVMVVATWLLDVDHVAVLLNLHGLDLSLLNNDRP